MPLRQITAWHVIGGKLVRFGRADGPVPVTTVPGLPSAVTTSGLTSSSVTLSYKPPANDGGSPITGYVVSRDGAGGTTTTVSAATLSQQFRSLTASTTYHLTVAAINAVGTGAATTKTITTPGGPQPSGGMRFPGDPNPMVNNGTLYFGMSSDNAAGFTSIASFESQTGKPLGVHHYYDNGIGIPSIAVPNGLILSTARADLAAGRLPLGSTHVPGANWQAAGNGTFDANNNWIPNPSGGIYDSQVQAFITYCETPGNLSGPLFWVVDHEPEAGGGGTGDGNPTYYRSWMNRVRWNLDKWEADNGRKRQRLTFLTCHTAYMWAGGNGGPAAWWPGDHVPDVVGVDCYAEHSQTVASPTDSVVQSSNFKKFHAFVTQRNLTWALTEYGTLPINSNGNGVLKETYNYCTDGTQDCVLLAYFNSGWWHLTDDNLTLSEAKTEAKNAKSIHISDLGY